MRAREATRGVASRRRWPHRRACVVALALALSSACASRPAALDVRDPLSGEVLSAQTLVWMNARLALRDGRASDVLKLWLVRNGLVDQGEKPLHDGDFRSLLWASLSLAGLCHDGVRHDDGDGGVGLWPLALHNWLVRSTSRQPAPPQPRTFSSYDTGFQQRFFSLYDVLSLEEWKGARFVRANCLRPYLELPFLGTPHWLDLEDRLSTGIMMRDLVLEATRTLDKRRVKGMVVLETRLFDIEVALARLAKSAARRETGLLGQLAKTTGVSASAMTLVREERLAAVRASEYSALLRRSLTWDAESWFSLHQNRRLALFAEASDSFSDTDEAARDVERTLLQNIDALIAKKDGRELESWLAFAHASSLKSGASDEARARRDALVREVVLGDRGQALLGLSTESGFRERAVVALWRGTDALQRGRRMEAMRSFALAMKLSEESRRADVVHALAKRWFAFVLAEHTADEETMALLEEFVAPIDRNELLEVLLWRAAFYVDATSFARIERGVRRGGALDVRIHLLSRLANGDAGAMWREARDELASPQAILKFATQLTNELATESLDVRANHRLTLELGMALLDDVAREAARGVRRRIDAQLRRMQTLLDVLAAYDESPEGRARRAAPGAESYAGSVRLAPADPLPWPLTPPSVTPPSPFAPIVLTPVEWLDDDGARVYGWHIHER